MSGLSFDSTVQVYAKWLAKPPLFDLFLPNPDCMTPCYDPGRSMVLGFIAQFVFMVVVQAFSSKIIFYKTLSIGQKFLFCVGTVSMLFSVNCLARSARAVIITNDFDGFNNTLLTDRRQDFDASLGYGLGFHLFEVLMWLISFFMGLKSDFSNIHYKGLYLMAAFTALFTGECQYIACCLMLLELASPILKVAWMVREFNMADSAVVNDFTDMVLAPVLAVRILVLGWLMASAPRNLKQFGALSENPLMMTQIGFSCAVATMVAWGMELYTVTVRLGEGKPLTNTKPAQDKKDD